MEGRLAVELTDSCENSTPESEETDTEEKIFNAIFAEEDESTLKQMRMLIEVELIERDMEEKEE